MRNLNIPRASNANYADPSTWEATKKVKMTTPITFGMDAVNTKPFVTSSESTNVALPVISQEPLKESVQPVKPVTLQKPLTLADTNMGLSSTIQDNLDTPNINIDSTVKTEQAIQIPEEEIGNLINDTRQVDANHKYAVEHQQKLQNRLANVMSPEKLATLNQLEESRANEKIDYSSDNVFGRATPNEQFMFSQITDPHLQKTQVDFTNSVIKDAILTASGMKMINSGSKIFNVGSKVGEYSKTLNKIKKVGKVAANVEEAPGIIGEHLFSSNKIINPSTTKYLKLFYKGGKHGIKEFAEIPQTGLTSTMNPHI